MAYTTIKKPSDYFTPNLHTGNGSTQSITSLDFQPDLIWIKQRNTTQNNRLIDSIRGNTKEIYSDLSNAEDNLANGITSFDSNGFGLGSSNGYNQNAGTYASWNWKANGTGSANTDGSISSTVSANTTSGFSIVSYTGTGANATIGHGLNSAPQVVLIKERNGTNNWLMSHQPLSASLGDYTRFMTLNSTSAVSGAGNIVFQNSAFTSSVFNVGTSAGSNGSGQNFIAYCFADVQGYSKFGSYVGNSSTDGTFVYTGFKPAFIMIKETGTGTQDWYMNTGKINGYNVQDDYLAPNTSASEVVGGGLKLDMLSNGFKLRANAQGVNTGYTYIYMAFAEQPLVGDNPATAR